MKNKYRNFWLNKRHEYVCGLNNLSFVTYHDMFAGEYQVGYGRFHSVEKLHASSYINGESQCLILIHYYTYNTHKYIVATGYLQFTSTGVNWAWINFSFFCRQLFIVSHIHMISIQHYISKWQKKPMTHVLPVSPCKTLNRDP